MGKSLTKELTREFPKDLPVTMRWSGCPAGCGDRTVADIGFQGAKTRVAGEIVDAVNIFAEGRSGPNPELREEVMGLVPVSKLGEVVPQLLHDLESARNREEAELAMAPDDD